VWPDTLRFLANSGIDMTPVVTQRFDADHALDALEAAHHPESTVKAHIELRATL
jgi:L-iditol 2-dehydrogenase